MFTNINGPPIATYEQVITPVAVATKESALSKKDRREPAKTKKLRKRKNKGRGDPEDILFEPFLGSLFDFSA